MVLSAFVTTKATNAFVTFYKALILVYAFFFFTYFVVIAMDCKTSENMSILFK
jgi:hypothetical protein